MISTFKQCGIRDKLIIKNISVCDISTNKDSGRFEISFLKKGIYGFKLNV